MIKRRKRDVYIAIMRAAARGEGLSLSAAECFDLSFDDAIMTRAHNGLDRQEWAAGHAVDWASVNPYRERVPANLLAVESPAA